MSAMCARWLALLLPLGLLACTTTEFGSSSPVEEATPNTPIATVTVQPTPLASSNSSPMIAYVSADGALLIWTGQGDGQRIYRPENGFVYYPEWSPDGSKLAFTEIAYADPFSGIDYADPLSVVVIDESGAELTRVARAIMPHWSPNSDALSFLAEPEIDDLEFLGTPAILNIDTGVVQTVVPRISSLDAPRWEPSGQALSYATRDGIYLVDSEGESTRRIVAADASTLLYLSPIWSEDGRLLAFERDRSESREGTDSYVLINPKTGITSRVGDSNPGKCGRDPFLRAHEAVWLPGGSLAAWGVECPNDEINAGFWIKDVTGGGTERFIDTSAVVRGIGSITVSPDGRQVAFSDAGSGFGIGPPPPSNAPLEGLFNVYAVSTSGGEPGLLIPNARHPTYRPTQ